jgi:DNA helicase-2/ATP-dependent DNA helicase PcrA
VAITRAKEKLWIINAKRRTIYGLDNVNPPSRFIGEINPDWLDIDGEEEKPINKEKSAYTIDENIVYKTGEHIMHNTYGEGVIVSVADKILTVAFPHPTGIKMLMKGHSSFHKI